MTKRFASLARERAAGAGAGLREGDAQPRSQRGRRAGRQAAGDSWARRGAALALLLLTPAGAAWAQQRPVDLTTASIEELMQVQVTSASKRQEKFFETAAAIYVISQEDIRRSGATSIPELLRMVPGMDVAHIDASKWAISSRGFNDRFATKMLVLIDGRTVYTPAFSGVQWDVQDTLLEDIERIEVIRGPGATLWGANAVNGVIIIITKPAKDTQGGRVTAGAGNQERGFGAVRYGRKAGAHGYYRFFAKYFNRDEFANLSGQDAADSWNILRGGFRTDWDLSGSDALTVQGDYYHGTAGETAPSLVSLSPPLRRVFDDRAHIAGGDILGRWKHTYSSRSDATLQLYYDSTRRNDFRLREAEQTFDLDFQHHIAVGERHDIIWGFGYRFNMDRIPGSLAISFNPVSRRGSLYSGFVQDEIVLVSDRLRLTLGTRLEHNSYTGFEVQPDLRLLWTPHPHHAIWAAVSRAVRNPARRDVGLRVNIAASGSSGGTINLLALLGNPQLKAETVIANELGYRAQLSDRVALDLAAFYSRYDHLRDRLPGAPFFEASPSPPHLVIPLVLQNATHGETHGIELAPNWNVTRRWRLSGGYTWFQGHLLKAGAGGAPSTPINPAHSPRSQFNFRSFLNLPGNLEFDAWLYYVSRLPNFEAPSYTRLDLRLGWRPTESLEISLVGQNLLDARHFEFDLGSQGANAAQVKRSGYGKLTWRF